MGIFGSGKDKTPQDAFLQTLAYLEEALRQRSPFSLQGPGGAACGASPHSVNEDGRTFRLLPDQDFKAEKGAKVDFTFILDGLRVGGTTRATETRQGVVVLAFPPSLALMERRRVPRARLNAKEGASLTALQGLFEGVGIHSAIENLSEGGARVRVERALMVATEKRLVLGTGLVAPGQSFVMLKLNKVPRSPAVLETSGRAVYLAHDGVDLVMGFRFDKAAPEVEAALRRLVASRAKPIPDSLPPKTRRPKDPEPAPEPEPARGPVAGRAEARRAEASDAAPGGEPLAGKAEAPGPPSAGEPLAGKGEAPGPASAGEPLAGRAEAPDAASAGAPVAGRAGAPEAAPAREALASSAEALALSALQDAATDGALRAALPSIEALLEPGPGLLPATSLPLDPGLPSAGAERRTHLRLSLGPGFQARFRVAGAGVPDADLLDVSVGGCCLRLGHEGCRALEAGLPLEAFHFLHKALPNGILEAQVSWILGKNAIDRPGPAEGRYCLVGVRFGELPPEILEGLEAYIAWNIRLD